MVQVFAIYSMILFMKQFITLPIFNLHRSVDQDIPFKRLTPVTDQAICPHHLTRMPSFLSQCSGFDALARGPSGTCPTDTPYFQSGGQIAMKRA